MILKIGELDLPLPICYGGCMRWRRKYLDLPTEDLLEYLGGFYADAMHCHKYGNDDVEWDQLCGMIETLEELRRRKFHRPIAEEDA